MNQGLIRGLFLLALVGATPDARGQDAPSERVRGIKRLQLRPNTRGRAKDAMKSRTRDASEIAPEAADQVEAIKRGLKARRAARSAMPAMKKPAAVPAQTPQAEQRVAARRKLSGRWTPSAVDAERRHARRLAILARIRELAERKKDRQALLRVDQLVARENARHAAWIAEQSRDAEQGGQR